MLGSPFPFANLPISYTLILLYFLELHLAFFDILVASELLTINQFLSSENRRKRLFFVLFSVSSFIDRISNVLKIILRLFKQTRFYDHTSVYTNLEAELIVALN